MANTKLDLGLLLRSMSDQLIGYTLDLARVSQLGDRQFRQFEISIKKNFRETIDSNLELIKEYNDFTISDTEQYLEEKKQDKSI